MKLMQHRLGPPGILRLLVDPTIGRATYASDWWKARMEQDFDEVDIQSATTAVDPMATARALRAARGPVVYSASP